MSVPPARCEATFRKLIELVIAEGRPAETCISSRRRDLWRGRKHELGRHDPAASGNDLIREHVHRSELHPDAWVAMPSSAILPTPKPELKEVAGPKYSYRELDNYTDLIQRTLQGAARSVASISLRRSAGANLSGLLPAAPGAVRVRSIQTEKRPECAEHHPARRIAGSRAEGHATSIRRAYSPTRKPSATSSSAFQVRTARSICATSWTFRAVTKARPVPELPYLAGP